MKTITEKFIHCDYAMFLIQKPSRFHCIYNSLIISTVTKHGLLPCKKPPFTSQKATFYNAKDDLLHFFDIQRQYCKLKNVSST